MKKLLQINGSLYGSTGFIMRNISDIAMNNGWTSYMMSPLHLSDKEVNFVNYIRIGNQAEKILSIYLSHLTGYEDRWNFIATYKVIKTIKKINPDIVHMHNIHGNYINIPMLVDYLSVSEVNVVWTLHDCWGFTGGCAYFDMCGCEKWKESCGGCPQLGIYPNNFKERTNENFLNKKDMFEKIIYKTTIVAPSKWLCNLASQSIFNGSAIRHISNGIDLNVFRYKKSNILDSKVDKEKVIVLGVSAGWTIRKGIDVFNQLAEMLTDVYQIILVGNISSEFKINQKIICWGTTKSRDELAQLYSMADVFVNPTREDNFPTVNIEALACGTPVITFNTGGSPESIDDTCGIVIEKNNVYAMRDAIIKSTKFKFSKEACVMRALQYDMNKKFKEYIELYDDIIEKKKSYYSNLSIKLEEI